MGGGGWKTGETDGWRDGHTCGDSVSPPAPPQLPTEGEVTIPLDVTLPPQMPPLLYPPLKKKKIIRQFMLMFNVGGRAP